MSAVADIHNLAALACILVGTGFVLGFLFGGIVGTLTASPPRR